MTPCGHCAVDGGVLLAVDPGLNSPGVAVFVGGELRWTAVLKPEPRSLNMGRRCFAVAEEIGLEYLRYFPVSPNCVAAEWPIIVPGSRQKAPPNDQIPLAGISVGVAAFVQTRRLTTYTPGEWSGGLSAKAPGSQRKRDRDAAQSPRGQRVLSRLSPPELAVIEHAGPSHDILDAVGIGLYHLGRFERRRVLYGATAG